MYIKSFLIILPNVLKKDHADVKFEFYLSRRSKFVHMGLDVPLMKISKCQEILELIEKLWIEKKKDDKFTSLHHDS